MRGLHPQSRPQPWARLRSCPEVRSIAPDASWTKSFAVLGNADRLQNRVPGRAPSRSRVGLNVEPRTHLVLNSTVTQPRSPFRTHATFPQPALSLTRNPVFVCDPGREAGWDCASGDVFTSIGSFFQDRFVGIRSCLISRRSLFRRPRSLPGLNFYQPGLPVRRVGNQEQAWGATSLARRIACCTQVVHVRKIGQPFYPCHAPNRLTSV